jgi:hypothetical protein
MTLGERMILRLAAARGAIADSERELLNDAMHEIISLRHSLLSITKVEGCECDDYHAHRCGMCKVREIAREALG